MNPKMRWCPKPDCVNYVEKIGRAKTAKCVCGTVICLKCGAIEHPGFRCGNVAD